jgi:hypothetical protein
MGFAVFGWANCFYTAEVLHRGFLGAGAALTVSALHNACANMDCWFVSQGMLVNEAG